MADGLGGRVLDPAPACWEVTIEAVGGSLLLGWGMAILQLGGACCCFSIFRLCY